MSDSINSRRRRFFGTAAVSLGAAELALSGFPRAQSVINQSASITEATPSNTSFGTIKQVNAGVLNIGYAESGPDNGPTVILLHGWPYDSFVDVAPLLAAGGYRVIVPYTRGYGIMRFLSSSTAHNGQQSVVALDTIALMDALNIQKAILAGYDWGARTACVIAAL